jgi:hypothetical protein
MSPLPAGSLCHQWKDFICMGEKIQWDALHTALLFWCKVPKCTIIATWGGKIWTTLHQQLGKEAYNIYITYVLASIGQFSVCALIHRFNTIHSIRYWYDTYQMHRLDTLPRYRSLQFLFPYHSMRNFVVGCSTKSHHHDRVIFINLLFVKPHRVKELMLSSASMNNDSGSCNTHSKDGIIAEQATQLVWLGSFGKIPA